MYDNRQNNRFSIFIGAIVVSLLVLITGCSSAQKEINTDEPITEDSSNPVTLTVYLTAHYANPDTHCPIYEKLLDYQKENPNITIQFVSPKEGDTAEREAEIHQLNTEILSGKGPDLFIMEGNRLTYELCTTRSGICFGCAFCWGRCADRNVLGKKKEE